MTKKHNPFFWPSLIDNIKDNINNDITTKVKNYGSSDLLRNDLVDYYTKYNNYNNLFFRPSPIERIKNYINNDNTTIVNNYSSSALLRNDPVDYYSKYNDYNNLLYDDHNINMDFNVKDEYITNNKFITKSNLCTLTTGQTSITPYLSSNSERSSQQEIENLKYYLVSDFNINFINMIINDEFEYGMASSSEIFLKNQINSYGYIIKEALNNMFLKYFENIKIITGILRVISHFDYKSIRPEGPTMALAALSHKNSEVQENAVRAFEHWGNSDSLKALSNIKCHSPWIQEYVDKVISYIKKDIAS